MGRPHGRSESGKTGSTDSWRGTDIAAIHLRKKIRREDQGYICVSVYKESAFKLMQSKSEACQYVFTALPFCGVCLRTAGVVSRINE